MKDNGIGIKKRDIENLFLPYGNKKKISKLNPTGMGLGLSICKRVCESLNGNISVKSSPGVGSTFVFSIEAKKDPNTLDADDTTSDSISTSERSHMFFKERKEKLKV